ncbi:MAG: hypothetical protein HC841_00395 [Verrucomicrobiae bacterium]|nr:hypothetical protein [Verrucomicrobiae bacterium]
MNVYRIVRDGLAAAGWLSLAGSLLAEANGPISQWTETGAFAALTGLCIWEVTVGRPQERQRDRENNAKVAEIFDRTITAEREARERMLQAEQGSREKMVSSISEMFAGLFERERESREQMVEYLRQDIRSLLSSSPPHKVG